LGCTKKIVTEKEQERERKRERERERERERKLSEGKEWYTNTQRPHKKQCDL
jgi:hypothetical protein